MNAERLLALYERIADAPAAVARLRRFVLDLAVRGKLVPQDPRDEPIAAWLGKTLSKKFVGESKKAKLNGVTLLDDFSRGYSVPKSWLGIELGHLVTTMDAGWSPQCDPHPRSDVSKWGVLKTTSVQTLAFDGAQNKELPGKFKPRPQMEAKVGDILVTRAGPKNRVGVCCVVDNIEPNLMISDKLIRVRLAVGLSARFVALALSSGVSSVAIEAAKSGMAVMQMNISQDKLRAVPIPLPPLAEQHRIVAKVDELMALCDRLEAARTTREATRDRLGVATLTRLNAPAPETFQDDARFALDILPAMTTRPDQIKQLRQTILNLAVRGKLVTQDPRDAPAPRFDRSIPAGLQTPFALPPGWNWSRLNALGKLKGGGTPSKARSDFWDGVIPWVSPKDMKRDYIVEAQMSITDAAVEESAVTLIEPNSVLFVVRGMILAHSFPVAISHVALTINQDMKAIVLKEPSIAEYLLRALKGLKPEMLARVQRSSHGTCRLEGSEYGDFLVPIPPLAEQHRIVAKVNDLMALCDRLEALLTTAAATRSKLLDTLLAEALSPPANAEREAA